VSRQNIERAKSGARWFYWIAALSLITSIISLMGGGWGFIASLGVTQIIDAVALQLLAPKMGEGVKIVAFFFDLLAAALFVLIGYFAGKFHSWVFVAGMALYLLDALIFILAGKWLGLAFHAYVLYSIFGGYKACTRLTAADRNAPPPPPPVATPV
jgi:hypothetical protein